MNYTVVWQPSAEQDLAALWTNAPDREAVASAADRIDALLRRDPQLRGESRSGATRIMFVPPLAVFFEVEAQDRIVYVTAVARSGRQR